MAEGGASVSAAPPQSTKHLIFRDNDSKSLHTLQVYEPIHAIPAMSSRELPSTHRRYEHIRGQQPAERDSQEAMRSVRGALGSHAQITAPRINGVGGIARKGRRFCISRRFTISITLAGVVVSGITLWPSYKSMRYDELSLALAQWTAAKEFLELCAARKAGQLKTACAKAQKFELPAPPGMLKDKQDKAALQNSDIQSKDASLSEITAGTEPELPSVTQTSLNQGLEETYARDEGENPISSVEMRPSTTPADALVTMTSPDPIIGYTRVRCL